MSTLMDDEIKRWTAKRKSVLVLELLQGKTTVAEASRAYDLPLAAIKAWVEDAKAGMENALRACQSAGPPGVIRAAVQRTPGGVRRGDAGTPRPKKLESLLEDGK